MALLDLPPEILTHILLCLPTASVLRCKRLNQYLQNLISQSVELQYHIRRGLSELLDNPHCKLSVSERLDCLLKENRWEELDLNFKESFHIPFTTSGIYDLTGGIYLLGNVSRKVLHYIYLPSEPNQEVEWKEVRLDKTIIDMGLCVYEHDLLAVITIQPQAEQSGVPPRISFDIRMHLYQVSTGKLHPDAQRPVISVMQTEWERPAVGIEIVGNNLVLILAYHDNPHKPDDCVFVYEWKSGTLKMTFRAPYHSYSGLLFLTEDIILLPNTDTGTLEYWRIPQRQSDAPTQPFLVLSLPKLNPDRTFGHISCRADPNPTTSFRHSSRPFHPDPHHAIAIFNISIRSADFHQVPGFPHPLQFSYSFVFFTHRSSLVNCIDTFREFISYDEDPQPVPYDKWGESICRWFSAEAFSTRWITTTSGQRCVILPDIGGDTVPAPIMLLNFNQTDVAKASAAQKERENLFPTLEGTEIRGVDEGPTSQSPTQDESQVLEDETQGFSEGDEDGVEVTSIEIDDDDDEDDDGWQTDESGELDTGPTDDNSDGPNPVPHHSQLQRRRCRVRVITDYGESLEDSHRCFQNIIHARLPYTVCSTTEEFRYHGVLMDEERIIGLRTNFMGRIVGADIFHYG